MLRDLICLGTPMAIKNALINGNGMINSATAVMEGIVRHISLALYLSGLWKSSYRNKKARDYQHM